MEVKKFSKGGIHPHSSKFTAGQAITNAHMPQSIRIPMAMHLGAPAKVKVKEGDTVEEGQLIGEATSFVSANIHSSVSGKVISVTQAPTLNAKKVDYVEIETGGSIRNWYDKKNDPSQMKPEKILDKIKDAGIVGMGGATFPTHVKLAPGNKQMEMLIINGAECEPYLTIDHRMMLEKADELIQGIRVAMRLLKVHKTIIGIEDNKPDAIEHLTEMLKSEGGIDVQPLRTMYPQGGEKQLIEAITGKQVPSGGLPLELGVVVLNVGTVYAMYEALVYDKPLIERGLTYTGEGIENAGNYKVRIGAPVQSLIDEFGIPEEHGTILAGGPMMGLEVTDTQIPVMKGTSGVLILPKKKDYIVANDPCIRCTACVHVCPIGLHPYKLGKLVDLNQVETAGEDWGLMDCIECGSCAFVCPSRIPLVALFRFGKMMYRRKLAAKKK